MSSPDSIRQNSVQIIFFDAAGTLFEVRGSVGEIYSAAAQRYGVEVEPASLQQEFLRHFPAQPPLAFPRGTPEAELHRLEKEWWRRLVQAVFADRGPFPRFDEFFDGLYEFFRGGEGWRLYDDTVPTLEALQARGLRLAVISNFDSRLDDVLRALRIGHYFAAVHLSTRAGAAKPDPAIFRAALERHQVSAAHAIHVGDGLREDARGAAAAGVNAIWLDRDQSESENGGLTRITRLGQLLELL
ncbi:MAG TPA: HAD-IA family hydrolase [Blastocatellia bacterium]|nr:HAD-IA family hydrolase [Blastocatellia bacterium]